MMRFEKHVARLPAMERDILRLHLDLKRTHSDIARILGMSQPAVYYRYKRARSRLDVWDLLPSVTPHEVRAVMADLGARDDDVQAMVHYVETNNQSEVARRMGVSQGWVRTSLMRAIDKHLDKDMSHDDRHVRVRQACKLLVSKPGMFTEVSNPALGHVAKAREVTRKLLTPPKLSERPSEGTTLEVRDGLYSGLSGVVESLEPLVTVKLDLDSQDIHIQWPS